MFQVRRDRLALVEIVPSNSFRGTIDAFRVGDDRSLTRFQEVEAHPPSSVAANTGTAAF